MKPYESQPIKLQDYKTLTVEKAVRNAFQFCINDVEKRCYIVLILPTFNQTTLAWKELNKIKDELIHKINKPMMIFDYQRILTFNSKNQIIHITTYDIMALRSIRPTHAAIHRDIPITNLIAMIPRFSLNEETFCWLK